MAAGEVYNPATAWSVIAGVASLSTYKNRSEAPRASHPRPIQTVAAGSDAPVLPVEIAGALAEIQRNVALIAQALGAKG